MSAPKSPWWSKNVHDDRRPFLVARNQVLRVARSYFEAQGFTEVECGALQVSPGNEAHLHAFATDMIGPDAASVRRYLHTSPEFASKKLLAAGEQKIFDFARVYRNRERGPLHAPEFTMLEWYRANEDYAAVMDDCLRLLSITASAVGATMLTYKGRTAAPNVEPERLTVADAFARYASLDLLSSLTPEPNRDALSKEAQAQGIKVGANDSWSDIFSRVLVERVEPHLGVGRATILYEYPRVEAALARACAHDRRLSERFEIYVCGVELANGFGELTDPKEQRARFEAEMREKERVYGDRYPIDEDFLSALAQMPPASGVALGFDRLVMLVTGASHIDKVVWTPTV
jgi:lysyl-tRNA synthetase class 2